MSTRDTGRVFQIVRESVDRGLTVEVEGLGVFRRDVRRGYLFEPQNRPRVFVAYAAEDLIQARRLCAALEQFGCAAWLDKDKLLPGQNWPRALERAIQNADAFIACFSPRSTAKRGQFQCELRYALDCARRLPLDHAFVIPVRLEPCEVPRRISDHVQYVDLFPHWNRGLKRVLRAVATSTARSAKDYCNRPSTAGTPE
jgi:hypothetical protein